MQINILVINKAYMHIREVSISCRYFLQPNCQQTKPIQHMLSIIMARPKNMQLTNAIKKLSIKRPLNTSCQINPQEHSIKLD